MKSLMTLLSWTKLNTVPVVATQGYTIAENRNHCVFEAMKHGCSHLLFIDDDMTFPSHTLNHLLGHKVHIVGVNSQSRKLPISTTVSLLKDGNLWPPNEVPSYYKMPEDLFEVFGVGMGVTLIDMEVFEDIAKPWFAFQSEESGKVAEGEDAWFCRKAREKSFKIWCDPTIKIGHIGDYNYQKQEKPQFISVKVEENVSTI